MLDTVGVVYQSSVIAFSRATFSSCQLRPGVVCSTKTKDAILYRHFLAPADK